MVRDLLLARGALCEITILKTSGDRIQDRSLADAGGKGLFVKELEDFFVNYHRLEGKRYRLLGCKGQQDALTLIKRAQKAA